MKHRIRHILIPSLCILLLYSCAQPATPTPSNNTVAYIPKPGVTPVIPTTQPVSTFPTDTALPNAQTLAVAMWVPSYLSETMGGALEDPLRGLFVNDESVANIKLEVGSQNVVSQWVYALVTPFSSTLQSISGDELFSYWQGTTAGTSILMDQNTHDMLTAFWGPTTGMNVQVIAKEMLLDYAWTHQPTLAIVPFNDLNPRWKVLPVDGASPIHKDFEAANYRLTIPISLNADPQLVGLIRSNFVLPPSNRDASKLTVVAVTGVTALVRATAFTMERRGMLYPAQDIREWLINADITHISNEVPFAVDCPAPNPSQTELRFCSQDEYIQLLEDIDTDVVELTGDHFRDWGTEAMLHTLEIYRERNWQYYGGGENLADGRKALLLEHNQNKIAFIGCNEKGFGPASDSEPGAATCDMDWMAGEIARLKAEGYLVIATFQHHEYYTYIAQPDQQMHFRQMANAGADIVSGSQAHQPQGMEFVNNSFIHYGLGNLFFDQYGLCDACELGLIDQHVFYDGRYLSTELQPIQFEDFARSRPMTLEEANALFESLFSASGWR